MSLKANIAASYIGQGWSGVMGLAFIPLYIRFLGMEAYGLIGLFGVLQAGLAVLDVGMTPTLNREMARFTAGIHDAQAIGNLLRTVETLCFGIAVAIGFTIFSSSHYLAMHWLKAEVLPVETVARALSVMAAVVALRFCEGIYRSSMLGLQRQVMYNVTLAMLNTLRHGGAVAVLVWISPTVEAFFAWQGTVSLLTVAVLAIEVHRTLPKSPAPVRFSFDALSEIRLFAGGMIGLTILSLTLTNVDKVLLSRLISLEQFGFYMVAATAAGALYMIVSPLDNAMYPRMVELSARNDGSALPSLYHTGSQLVTVLAAPTAIVLSAFAGGALFVWSGRPQLAYGAGPVLSIIAIGTLLNTLMHMPFHFQLANGWTSLAVKTNLISVLVLIPAVLVVAPRYGSEGVAWAWVILNASYILIQVPLMHRRLAPTLIRDWYVIDVGLPIAGVIATVILASRFQPAHYQDRFAWTVFLLATGAASLLVAVMLAPRIRRLISIPSAYLRSFGVILARLK